MLLLLLFAVVWMDGAETYLLLFAVGMLFVVGTVFKTAVWCVCLLVYGLLLFVCLVVVYSCVFISLCLLFVVCAIVVC